MSIAFHAMLYRLLRFMLAPLDAVRVSIPMPSLPAVVVVLYIVLCSIVVFVVLLRNIP